VKQFFVTVSAFSSFPVFIFFLLLFWLFSTSWFFLPFAVMLFFSMVISYILKLCMPMQRPKKIRSSLPKKRTFWNHWRFVMRSSFPSSHVARMSGLCVVTFFFSWWLGSIAVLFTLLVAYSRIFLKEHYWRDILGGLVLGLGSGFLAIYVAPFLSIYF
jgi:membrane-associated phospholipid phosphatase